MLPSVYPGRLLICTAPPKDDPDRLENDHDVVPKAPVAHVPTVQLCSVRELGLASAAYLPEAGKAGPRRQVELDVAAVVTDLAAEERSRTDQAHVSFQGVPELRELVDAGLPEQAPEKRDPGGRC